MRRNTARLHLFETVSYTLLAAVTVGSIFYLFYFDPVSYTRLISEDQWGEYGTSVSYGLTGLLLAMLLFRRGPRLRKVIWALMGLIAIFIAGEEISWGQRIFYFSTPHALSHINLQRELTLHNLETVAFINQHKMAAYLVLGWSIFSVVVSIWMPRLKDRMQMIGLPVIPIRLVPLFLLVPYFFLIYPTLKSDEIGELLLGIAAVAWACDLFLYHGWTNRPVGLPAVGVTVGILFLIALMSMALAHRFPGNFTWRLNTTAVRDYPAFGMYDQAQILYDYIYAHPKYITDDTWINHGRMLLKVGKQNEAFRVLSHAAEVFEGKDPPEAQRSSHLRRLGIIYTLLGQSARAEATFNQAMEVDQQQFALVSNPDQKAMLLWSLAQTLEARSNVVSAIEQAKQARAQAISPVLQWRIEKWIESLENT